MGELGLNISYNYPVDDLIPKYGWKARFDHEPEVHCKPFTIPRLSQLKQFISMSFRTTFTFRYYIKKRLLERRLPFLDPSKHVPWVPVYGVPMGGIGCGAIGRGFRGEFLRSSLIPGMYCYDIQPADQFIVTLRRNGVTIYHNVLSPHKRAPVRLTSLDEWTWGFPSDHAHYTGLYPRSWTLYELPEYHLILICKQISPVIPHNYASSCLPVCIFVWEALNFSTESIHVTITFSWHGPSPPSRKTSGANSSVSKPPSSYYKEPCSSCQPGSQNDEVLPSRLDRSRSTDGPRPGFYGDEGCSVKSLVDEGATYACRSASFIGNTSQKIAGCLLERKLGQEMDCCFGIAAKESPSVRVGCCPGFLFNKPSPAPFRSRNSDDQQTRSTVKLLPTFFDHFSGAYRSSEVIAYHPFEHAPYAGTFWQQLGSSSGLPSPSEAVGYDVSVNAGSRKRTSPRLAVAVSSGCEVPPVTCIPDAATSDIDPPLASASKGDTGSVPGRRQFEFALVWHAPVVRFRSGDVVYTRRYVRWFPEPGMMGARHLLEHALTEWPLWESSIDQWQNPILQNNTLTTAYKSALFNELYYLTDGGSVWLDPVSVEGVQPDASLMLPIDLVRAYKLDSSVDPHQLTGRHLTDQLMPDDRCGQAVWLSWRHRCQLAQEIGLFAYLEGHEYRMFNTIDVHHYASWALIKLWPKLQLAIMYDCADLTVAEDRVHVYYMHRGQLHARSRESAVPHDFGDPEDEPWRRINAYVMFPTDEWKDLNPKFVLQVWRDWRHTRDYYYLLYLLPITCRIVRKCLLAWDSDEDGIIENSGFPDQTYDSWKVKGMSAYTGGIWLACVFAAHDMLQSALASNSPLKSHFENGVDDLGTPWIKVESKLSALLAEAKIAYDTSLWTGTHYAYQKGSSGANHRSIMAAQLSGHWFLRVAGAPSDAILPQEHVKATLKTLHDVNWQSIDNGSLGAINGALSPFRQDTSSVQAEEFWVGVNYALAATMVMEGMQTEGLALAGSCYNTVYNRFGLQYQTPEAYMRDGRFRCPGYMRPLSVWSIQQALELTASPEESAVS